MYSSTQKIAICGSNVCIWTCFGFDCDVCWRRRSSGGSAAGSRPTRQRHESAVGKLRGVEGTKDDLAWNNKNGDLTNEKIIVMMMMMMMMHIFLWEARGCEATLFLGVGLRTTEMTLAHLGLCDRG